MDYATAFDRNLQEGLETVSIKLPIWQGIMDISGIDYLGLDRVLKEEAAKGKPLMGICLGMQLLFERSFEYGEHEGLGLLKGEIRPIAEQIPQGLKIPQMGWNGLIIKRESPLLRYTREGDFVYFVHSYSAVGCDDSLLAVTEYGAELTACVGKDNVFGCQFHPEKSGNVGLNILRAFCETEAAA